MDIERLNVTLEINLCGRLIYAVNIPCMMLYIH